MTDRRQNALRFFGLTLAILANAFVAVPAAMAQTDGGWTLNIDNTGYNPIQAGALLPYTVRINNNNPAASLAQTSISFAIPANVEFVDVVGLNDCVATPTETPTSVTCVVPALAIDGKVDAKVNLRPMQEGTINFTGTMAAPGPTVSKPTTVQKGADLAVALSVSPETVQSGSRAVFTATVVNNGPYPSDHAKLVIPVPAGLSPNVELPAGCSITANLITCEIAGPIAVGQSLPFEFSSQVVVANASTITVAAAISSTAPRDGVTNNNDATANINVIPGTDVSLGKTRSPQLLILVGDAVTFTLSPRFVGSAPTSASIRDVLPANYEFVSVTPTAGSGWACSPGQTVDCDYLADVGTDYTAPITIVATAIAATPSDVGVTNTAVIESPNENDDAWENNSANDGAAFIAVPTIDLVAQKSGPRAGLVIVNEYYEFTLLTRNDGNAGFHGPLTITDHLPAGLTLTAASLPPGWACSPALPLVGGPGVDLSCVTDNYTPANLLDSTQQTPPLVFTALVTAAGKYSNGMTVSYPGYDQVGGDINPGNNTTTVGIDSAEGPNAADVSVDKIVAAPVGPIDSGDEVTFEIEIRNAGPASAKNVVMDDRLNDIVNTINGGAVQPGDVVVTHTLGNATGLVCSLSNSGAYSTSLQCIIDDLPMCMTGDNCPVVTVTARTGSQGVKTNTADVFSTLTPDPLLGNNTSSIPYEVVGRTDVRVEKSSPVSGTGAKAGQELVYVLTAIVPPTGLSSAENVTLTDTLPAGLRFISADASSGSCSAMPLAGSITHSSNNQLICNLGTIANGSQQTVTVRVVPTTAIAETTVTNTVVVATTTNEPDKGNNSAQLPIEILAPELDLIISKIDSVDPLEIGKETIYTVTLTNSGPSDAFNVSVLDTLPLTGMGNARIVNDAGFSCTLPAGQVLCTSPYMAANTTVEIKIGMTGLARGRHTNSVEVTSDETGSYERPQDNNFANEDTTVRERVDLKVTKVASVGTVDLRKEFSWTITVENQVGDGFGIADAVTLVDVLPAGMELTRVPTTSAGTCVGVVGQRNISCELGDMAIGATVTITLYTKITSLSAQSATNQATATTLSFEQNPEDNTGSGSVNTVEGNDISGMIYRDFNGLGTKDAEDTGIEGVTVYLVGRAIHDNVEITLNVPTNPDGTYSFVGLPPGTYSVYYSSVDEDHLVPGRAVAGSGAGTAMADGKARIDDIVITNAISGTAHNFTLVPTARLGIGKVAGTITVNADGTYSIPYSLTVTNYSLEPLTGISVTDVLDEDSQNFGAYSGGTAPSEGQYRITGTTGSFGPPSSSFNGATDTVVLSGATLAAGATATVGFTVHVNPKVPRIVPALVHTNQATISGTGQYSTQTPNDFSNNTANPDPDGNGIPDEDTPTKVTPDAGADVTLSKSATPRRTTGTPAVGDVIDYAFTITNSGKTALLDVTLTDPMVGLVWTANTPIARLEPGEANDTAYQASYALTQPDIDRGTITNTAGVSGQWGLDGVTPVNVTDTASASASALSEPGLTIIKAVDTAAGIGNPRTLVGNIVRYSFVVTNTGNTTLNDVVISDALAGVAADPAGSFTIDTMAPGEIVKRYATYPVKQVNIDAGNVTNSATASAVYGPSNTPITTLPSSVDVPLYRQPGLTLVKTLTSTIPDIPLNGTTVTWNVTATNTGNVTLTDLRVTDAYPGAVVLPVKVDSLAPGDDAVFTVSAPLQQSSIDSGSLDNTATINYDAPTGAQPPVDASHSEPLPPQTPKIALQKTADISALTVPPMAGQQIAYTIIIRNTGNVPLDGITLADILTDVVLNPADMLALSTVVLQPQNAAGDADGTETTVHATYALKTADIEAGSVINTAVTTGKSVPNPGQTVTDQGGTSFDTNDPTTTVLSRDPRISLTKSISSAALSTPPQAGDIITYAFTITNTGNVNLDTVDLTDAVAGVTVLNPSGWTGPLAPGISNSTAITATYAITQADIDAGVFVNTATAAGEGIGAAGLPTEVTSDSSATQSLDKVTGLTLLKSEVSTLSTPPKIGDRIDYSFVLTNTGNTTLTNLVLSDPLPGLVWDTGLTVTTLLPGTANAVTLRAHYLLLQSDIQAGKVDNQALVSFDDPSGPQTAVPSNPVSVPLDQVPGIAVVKTAVSGLSDPAVAGETITYSFTVTNTGNLELKGVVITDPLVGITPSTINVGDLLPGQVSAVFTATYDIDVDDIVATEVVNQATVTGTYDDGSGPQTTTDLSGPTNETDEPTIVPVLQARPSMAIVKTGSFAKTGAYVYVGDVIDYAFEVTNTGNVPLENVTPRELGITFGGKPATGTLEAISPGPQLIAVDGKAAFTTRYALTQDDINNAAGLANGVANRADATAEFGGTPVSADPDDAVLSIPTQEPADITILKRALVSTIRRGETAGFVITVTNNSLADVGLVTITDRLPAGFTFVEGSASVNAVAVTPDVVGPVVTFSNVRLGPKNTVEIGLVLRALPTTPPGTYRNIAEGIDSVGTPLAPPAHAEIRIEAEGVFDCSDVIGTVFNDLNRNGYQDQDEPGIPGVRLATVRGTLITTDAHGRYSVPCADLPNGNIGSNFVLKIDERTLPTGFSMTTDNPGLVRLTAGKMVELNFGASIGREIRLKLNASAFVDGSLAPKPALESGLNQVIALLAPERSTLFLTYPASANAELARQRLDHIVALIRQLWRNVDEPYRLVINTDIVEN